MNEAIRKELHELIDRADENQLEVVREVLQPSASRYSNEEIASFYHQIQLFEEGGSNGYSVKESHAAIRNKYNQDTFFSIQEFCIYSCGRFV